MIDKEKIEKIGQLELNRIYQMDCLEGMKLLPEQSVDLLIADPPYVISKKSNFHTMPDRKKPRTGTDFGEWDKDLDNKEWIELSYQKLKNGGSIIIFNDFKKATEIYNIATEVGFEYKDTLIWHKTNPMPRNRNRRYIPNIEMIQWYVKKNGKWTFNRQNEKYESCVLSFPSESGGGFKRYHPTQKPVKLIEYLIRIHSNENDIILDPFIGGGTTAVAALKNNRKFIGFEIDAEYYKMANERIKKFQSEI